MAPLLELRNITKQFPGVLADDRVSLTVEAGQIHALLGENGAGKSTLMHILYGLSRADAGEILLEGQPLQLHSPADAIAHGIGMIHQDFMLIPRFSVVENVVIGLQKDGPQLDLRSAALRLSDLARQYGLAVDPAARVEHLSVGVQQRVEILKLLYRHARLLILDEPTGVLTPQETEGLFAVLRRLAAQGHAVLLITHKLHEVIAVADQVTVLRDGRVIGSLPARQSSARQLARMMVGREVTLRVDKPAQQAGPPLLQITDLQVRGDNGQPKVRGVTLTVHGGEILGLAGVDGNGQSELAEALMGLRPVEAGQVTLAKKDLTRHSPAARRASHLGYIPADRRQVGSIGPLSIAYNAVLGTLRRYTTWGGLFLNPGHIDRHARHLVNEFDVRTPSIHFEAGKLSGGNLQKVVLGRELLARPTALVVEQPTRGLDVGATEYVHRQLLAERCRGAALLLISAELEEILALSDRIAVLYQGEIMGVLTAGAQESNSQIELLGLMMAGSPLASLSNLHTPGRSDGPHG